MIWVYHGISTGYMDLQYIQYLPIHYVDLQYLQISTNIHDDQFTSQRPGFLGPGQRNGSWHCAWTALGQAVGPQQRRKQRKQPAAGDGDGWLPGLGKRSENHR